jgi:hypothetical protein
MEEETPALEVVGEEDSSSDDEETLMWKEWNSAEFTVNYKKYIRFKKNTTKASDSHETKTQWTTNDLKGKKFFV